MGVLRSVKAAQNFRESVFINQTANADMEDLPLPASDLSSRLDPLVPVLLQTNSLLVEHPSGRSELRAISGFEQGKPYFLFQTFDLVGNGRLAQIQFFGGFMVAPALRGRRSPAAAGRKPRALRRICA